MVWGKSKITETKVYPVGNKAFAVKEDTIIKECEENIILREYLSSCSHNAFPAVSYGV
ncbi:MAG: hypothetical protein Q8O66_02840 [bacterium]|nr:hypothetical protein [bacterium]